jgi:hypothetical protein
LLLLLQLLVLLLPLQLLSPSLLLPHQPFWQFTLFPLGIP